MSTTMRNEMSRSGLQATVREGAEIELRGEIDGRAEAVLQHAYAEAAAPDPRRILLDFTEVGYINSTGIALIVGLLTRARQERREVVARGLSPHYREIFEITRLAEFKTILPA